MTLSPPTTSNRLELRNRPQHRRPVMYQNWRHLLFLHWQFDPTVIQATLPPGLHVDTFAAKAYVGLVPFYMRDVRPRFLPSVPCISNFLELNLRTYAYDDRGIPGVWFYSLDANQWLAVQVARKFFGLPYYYAEMHAGENAAGEITFSSRRREGEAGLPSVFRYRPSGGVRTAQPDSLEFFLVERYLLFSPASNEGQPLTGRIHHRPYPLVDAQVSQWDAKLFELNGFHLPGRDPDHVIMSPGVDVDVFPLDKP
jgi:uncharacterized protein YqjF (DUF2071 family)